jgi:[protein-PII] uridylyltransferase
MGYDHADTDVIERMVEFHLLLPDVATRRDLDDPVTIRSVAAQAGDSDTLLLLYALTEADSLATGTAAWGPWKAELVAELVDRAGHVLDGGDVAAVTSAPITTASHRELLDRCRSDGRPQLAVDRDRLTVVAADRPALFSRVAGVLALNGLDVVEASARSEAGMALDEFRVVSAFDSEIPWHKVERDLDRALRGRLALEPRRAERARSYRKRPTTARALEPNVRVLPDASEDSTVVEVVGPDSVGLLYRLTRALTDLDLDIASAKVATMAADVVDAFYVRTADGAKVTDPDDVAEIRTALLHALTTGT